MNEKGSSKIKEPSSPEQNLISSLESYLKRLNGDDLEVKQPKKSLHAQASAEIWKIITGLRGAKSKKLPLSLFKVQAIIHTQLNTINNTVLKAFLQKEISPHINTFKVNKEKQYRNKNLTFNNKVTLLALTTKTWRSIKKQKTNTQPTGGLRTAIVWDMETLLMILNEQMPNKGCGVLEKAVISQAKLNLTEFYEKGMKFIIEKIKKSKDSKASKKYINLLKQCTDRYKKLGLDTRRSKYKNAVRQQSVKESKNSTSRTSATQSKRASDIILDKLEALTLPKEEEKKLNKELTNLIKQDNSKHSASQSSPPSSNRKNLTPLSFSISSAEKIETNSNNPKNNTVNLINNPAVNQLNSAPSSDTSDDDGQAQLLDNSKNNTTNLINNNNDSKDSSTSKPYASEVKLRDDEKNVKKKKLDQSREVNSINHAKALKTNSSDKSSSTENGNSKQKHKPNLESGDGDSNASPKHSSSSITRSSVSQDSNHAFTEEAELEKKLQKNHQSRLVEGKKYYELNSFAEKNNKTSADDENKTSSPDIFSSLNRTISTLSSSITNFSFRAPDMSSLTSRFRPPSSLSLSLPLSSKTNFLSPFKQHMEIFEHDEQNNKSEPYVKIKQQQESKDAINRQRHNFGANATGTEVSFKPRLKDSSYQHSIGSVDVIKTDTSGCKINTATISERSVLVHHDFAQAAVATFNLLNLHDNKLHLNGEGLDMQQIIDVVKRASIAANNNGRKLEITFGKRLLNSLWNTTPDFAEACDKELGDSKQWSKLNDDQRRRIRDKVIKQIMVKKCGDLLHQSESGIISKTTKLKTSTPTPS